MMNEWINRGVKARIHRKYNTNNRGDKTCLSLQDEIVLDHILYFLETIIWGQKYIVKLNK
jgi:hypothetical protein